MPVRVAVVASILALVAAIAAPASGQTQPATTQPATTQPSSESRILERLLSNATTQPGDEVIARYDHATLTRDQLMEFLLETRGLDGLLNLMQLQIAKALAANEGIQVTLADVEAEQRATLRQALAGTQDISEEQYDDLLAQLLAQQQLSRAEFDVVIATNTYLKALARPQIQRMLTEEKLREAFNIRYGEQVRVRHIQLENLAQVAEVRKRLDAGEDFAKVAQEVSRNPDTKQMGGMFPPFSMQSEIPESFKTAAFSLQVGQVSDPVEANDAFHLIKLEERIAPKAVEYEKVREELKKTVAEEQVLVVTTQLRRLLAQMLASNGFEVLDPVLAGQLRQRLAQVRPQPVDAEEMKRQMEAQRPKGPATTTAPATQPAPAE